MSGIHGAKPIKLSIIVICWNDAAVLGPCLASIAANPPPFEFEVIVSDNGSSDNSLDIASAFGVRVLSNVVNLGYGSGNNAGAAIAHGQYLLFLNPDTIVHAGALAKLVTFMEGNPRAGVVGPRVLNPDGSFQLSAHPLPSPSRFLVKALFLRYLPGFPTDRYMNWRGEETRQVGFVAGCALLIRADLFRLVHGFDFRMVHQYEDTDLCASVQKLGLSVMYYPGATITHIRGIKRGGYPLSVLESTEESKRAYFAKHYGPPDILRFISILHYGIRSVGAFLLGRRQKAQTFGALLRLYLGGIFIPPGDYPYYINPHGYINPSFLMFGALSFLVLNVAIGLAIHRVIQRVRGTPKQHPTEPQPKEEVQKRTEDVS
jgi:GT2 family glycosyltransferase